MFRMMVSQLELIVPTTDPEYGLILLGELESDFSLAR
jgi:hypothetical protein